MKFNQCNLYKFVCYCSLLIISSPTLPSESEQKYDSPQSPFSISRSSSISSLSDSLVSQPSFQHISASPCPKALCADACPRPLSPTKTKEITEQLERQKEEKNKQTMQIMTQANQQLEYKKLIMTGSVAVITLGATQIPTITARILEQQKNDRFLGGFAIASTAMAALPTILSVAGAAYGIHQINNWIYGDVQNQIKQVRHDLQQETNARIAGDIEAMSRLATISTTSHQATGMLTQIRPELNKLQISNRKIEEKFDSIFPLMQDIQNQAQGLHQIIEIQHLGADDMQNKPSRLDINKTIKKDAQEKQNGAIVKTQSSHKSLFSKLFKPIKKDK